MTVGELKDKIKNIPDDSRIVLITNYTSAPLMTDLVQVAPEDFYYDGNGDPVALFTKSEIEDRYPDTNIRLFDIEIHKGDLMIKID